MTDQTSKTYCVSMPVADCVDADEENCPLCELAGLGTPVDMPFITPFLRDLAMSDPVLRDAIFRELESTVDPSTLTAEEKDLVETLRGLPVRSSVASRRSSRKVRPGGSSVVSRRSSRKVRPGGS